MKKRKILFMAQLPPPVHGASLRNKSLLDSKLINEEFEIISLPLKFIDDMTEMGKFSFRKILLMIRHAVRIFFILLTNRIQLVYFTMSPSGFAFYRDILFITIVKLFGKKRILHFRMKGLQQTGAKGIGRILVKYAFRGSDTVALSRHHLQDMQGFLTREPFIVPNGIKIEKEFLHLADEYRFDPSAIPKLLFVSNLSVMKGVPELIRACGMLKRQGFSFTTSIVGNEWYMTFAEATKLIADEELTGEVILEGPKFGKEKFEFIASADLFVFPTRFELFPGVVLEAMQFGKAIVSTFEGSIPDIIDSGVNGSLVEPMNADALAEAIARLLNDPQQRLQMAALAKEKFFREFTLEAFEKNMLTVFETVINRANK